MLLQLQKEFKESVKLYLKVCQKKGITEQRRLHSSESDDSRQDMAVTVSEILVAWLSQECPLLLLHASVDINDQTDGQFLRARTISNGATRELSRPNQRLG